MGPAMSQESAGASRRAVSGEESGDCARSCETSSALENGGESRSCSNVASGAASMRPHVAARMTVASEPASSKGASVAARRGSACEGQTESEPGAAGRGLSPDLPAVGLDDSAGDVEAEP